MSDEPTLVQPGQGHRTALWRRVFGKPDGWFPWLRCRFSGHLWTPCEDECCGGRQEWCDRCHAPRWHEQIVWGAK